MLSWQQRWIRAREAGDGKLPTRFGEWLVGIGALIVLVAPASGGWLVLGSGWAMWAARRTAASDAENAAQTSRHAAALALGVWCCLGGQPVQGAHTRGLSEPTSAPPAGAPMPPPAAPATCAHGWWARCGAA